MQTDALKISLKSFLAWRNEQPYRAKVKTRFEMLRYCGKDWRISEDHTHAYFLAVEDFATPEWDSSENRLGTMGYYADSFAFNIIRWCVVKIAPANKKHGREALYAPITYSTEWEGVTLHLDCVGSLEDAKRWGDSEAEQEAEKAREGDAQDQAEQQIDEQHNEIVQARIAFKKLHAELRTVNLPPAICAAIRGDLQSLRENVRSATKRIVALRDNFWLAVEGR